MNRYNNSEFHSIVKPILDNCPFSETKKMKHHGITRYEHSMRVAYFSYIITKFLKLDYERLSVKSFVILMLILGYSSWYFFRYVIR